MKLIIKSILKAKSVILGLGRKRMSKEIKDILETVHDAITVGTILKDDRAKGNSVKLAIQNHLLENNR